VARAESQSRLEEDAHCVSSASWSPQPNRSLLRARGSTLRSTRSGGSPFPSRSTSSPAATSTPSTRWAGARSRWPSSGRTRSSWRCCSHGWCGCGSGGGRSHTC